jgi:hypothetical protein
MWTKGGAVACESQAAYIRLPEASIRSLQVFLEHASTTSDTLQGLQATLQKLEVDITPYVSRLDPVYELDRNAIYTYLHQTQHGHAGPELRDHAYRLERADWSPLLCSMNAAACHDGTTQVELRSITDADNVMQRIERFAARHQGLARGERRLDQRSRHVRHSHTPIQGQSIFPTTLFRQRTIGIAPMLGLMAHRIVVIDALHRKTFGCMRGSITGDRLGKTLQMTKSGSSKTVARVSAPPSHPHVQMVWKHLPVISDPR